MEKGAAGIFFLKRERTVLDHGPNNRIEARYKSADILNGVQPNTPQTVDFLKTIEFKGLGTANDPYRTLHDRYKTIILAAATAGNEDEVARLTDKFNESIGGRLAYVQVTPRKGPIEQHRMLFSKFYGGRKISFGKINHAPAIKPHVWRTKSETNGEEHEFVSVETNRTINLGLIEPPWPDDLQVRLAVSAFDGWGKSAEGVQTRVQSKKLVWNTEETPQFRLTVRNGGKTPIVFIPHDAVCEMELDGTWYVWGPKVVWSGQDVELSPGKTADSRVDLKLVHGGPNGWVTKKLRKPLTLRPGKHTARFALNCDNGLVPISNPVAFTIALAKPLAIRIDYPVQTIDGKQSPKSEFARNEEIDVTLTITNQTEEDIQAPETFWSARVLFDKKEYKRLPKYTGDWNGPGLIIAGGKFRTGVSLAAYGITEKSLTDGKHTLAVKIGEVVSNSLTITIAATGAEVSRKLLPKPPETDKSHAKLSPVWEVKQLQHQFEATDVFTRNGFLYIGGGSPNGVVAKVKVSDGSVAWSVHTQQSYQPSYPVSNGRVVVFGRYYEDRSIVGLDDRTGQLLWTIPAQEQNMSAACFEGDLAFIGSYDRHLYAIDWSKGKIRWKARLPNSIWSTPCPYGKQILIGCYDGFLYAIERDTGKISWKIDCGGKIGSNPVVANHHAFLGVDDQKYEEDYDSSKVQKHLLVIDLKTRKIISRYRSPTEWSSKICRFR